jgi:hypothetical protein
VVVSADAETDTKTFTAAEFRRAMKSANFVGAVAFWRQLERLAGPVTLTRIHTMGVLEELARSSFADCSGMAFSPQQAECFEYLGLKPLGIRPPGAEAQRE